MNSLTDNIGPLDERAFGARVEPHRRELHVRCHHPQDRIDGGFDVEGFGSLPTMVFLDFHLPATLSATVGVR